MVAPQTLQQVAWPLHVIQICRSKHRLKRKVRHDRGQATSVAAASDKSSLLQILELCSHLQVRCISGVYASETCGFGSMVLLLAGHTWEALLRPEEPGREAVAEGAGEARVSGSGGGRQYARCAAKQLAVIVRRHSPQATSSASPLQPLEGGRGTAVR